MQKDQSQSAKADRGKPRISLVPMQILWDVAEIREYGTKKYKDPDNWKRVEMQRYVDALCVIPWLLWRIRKAWMKKADWPIISIWPVIWHLSAI